MIPGGGLTVDKRPQTPVADRPYAPGYGIVGPDEGKGLLPWTWVAGKMETSRTFFLATMYAGKTRPHVMPVWGVWLEQAFYFSTGRTSRKAQNLAKNPACTITNDDAEEAVIMEGEAVVVEDAGELERVAVAYQEKYKLDPRGMGEPMYRLRPEKVFGFEEKNYSKSSTRWRLLGSALGQARE
jgi:nitroimidazol reductase NimA-like FMN-containing flavoprotein (pyridoxamine 5'-phosphate oxidase superfamily)